MKSLEEIAEHAIADRLVPEAHREYWKHGYRVAIEEARMSLEFPAGVREALERAIQERCNGYPDCPVEYLHQALKALEGCREAVGVSEEEINQLMIDKRHMWRAFADTDDKGGCSDSPDNVYAEGFYDGFEAALERGKNG